MAENLMPYDAEKAEARRDTLIGAGFITLSFAAPALAAGAGLGNAATVGEAWARMLGSLLFLGVIAWLLTRNRTNVAKGLACIVVGMLLCLLGAWSVMAAADQEKVGKQFLRDALAFSAKHQGTFEELARRFDQVMVHQYLTPQSLTPPQAMAAGQAVLKRYRSLLQERNILLQSYVAEYVVFVSTIPPGEIHQSAELAIGPARQSTETLYKLLDKAQTAHADAIGALFDGAMANAGRLSVRDEQMVF